MKKGFTLIELLAVIVILAIIAIIAVPIVLNIINDSKESSLLRSAEFYLDAAEYAIADVYLYHGGLDNIKYPITPEGDICTKALPCDDDYTLKVEVNGDKPTGGYIEIIDGDIFSIELELDEKIIIKNSNGELIYQPILSELCNLEEGTAKTIGAKYECDFGGEKRNFYILELDTDNVTLILEGNYDTTTQAWCNQNGSNPSSILCNADGLNLKLDEISKSWKKLDRNQLGIPSVEQLAIADGKIFDGSFSISATWLYNWPSNSSYSTGYWTSSIYDMFENSGMSWFVHASGLVGYTSVDTSNSFGIRPIINIKK